MRPSILRAAVPYGFALLALPAVAAACHVDANVKTGTSEPRDEAVEIEAIAPPAAASPTAAQVPAAPATPPPDACPLSCYEARGSEKVAVTSEEASLLRSGLEPVIGRMRACVSPEDWRRHGSATVNLRVAPDGTVADVGVDPHDGSPSGCFQSAGRGASLAISLPGRKVVRCAERCVREAPRRAGRRAR